MAKWITEVGRENVVSSMYMHSHTFLFKSAVAANLVGSRFHRDDSYKTKLVQELNKLKLEMEKKEHSFYDLFSIAPGDISSREASFNLLLKRSVNDYKILQHLSSPTFYNFINKKLDTQLLTVTQYLDSSVYQQLVSNPNNQILATVYNMITNELKKGINFNFNGVTIKRSLRKVYTDTNLELTDAFKKSVAAIFKEIENSGTISQLNGNFYRGSLKNSILQHLQKFNPSQEILKVIEKSCDEIFSDYDTDLKNTSNQVGAIGEMMNKVSLDALIKTIDNKMTTVSYIGNLTTDKKKPPVDFLIDKYGIQAKNSKVLLDNFADIHILSSLKLETFLDRLANRLDTKAAQQYGYLFTNILWLKNNGLDSDEKESHLKISEIPEIMAFITDIISRAADILLSHRDFELQKEIEFDGKKSYGNVFFLYKNTYLIPLSKMMEGIIKAVELGRDDEADNTGVGYFSKQGLSYSIKKEDKEEMEVKSESKSSFNAVPMLLEKKKAIADMNEVNVEGFDYPRPIREIGRKYGNIFRSGIKVKLTYKLSLKQLAKMTNLYGLW